MSDIYDQLKYITRCKHTPDMFGGDKEKELFNKQLHKNTYAYTIHWLTKLGINWDIDNTGYYPEDPTTFHLSKTFHNIYPLEWDAIDFETVHDAGKWLDKRSKEVSKKEHLHKVSKDMGGYCHDETIKKFIKEADKYHNE